MAPSPLNVVAHTRAARAFLAGLSVGGVGASVTDDECCPVSGERAEGREALGSAALAPHALFSITGHCCLTLVSPPLFIDYVSVRFALSQGLQAQINLCLAEDRDLGPKALGIDLHSCNSLGWTYLFLKEW